LKAENRKLKNLKGKAEKTMQL